MKASHLKIYKQLFRRRMRRVLEDIPKAKKVAKSRRVMARLCRSAVYRNAQSVLLYVSMPQEVSTGPILRDLLQRRKKKVLIPRICCGRSQRIQAVPIQNVKKDLTRGVFGIFEPRASLCETRNLRRIDLAIIPGLAFDLKGRRLGRGGGYFDRFLKRIPTAYKIGVAFREQLFREVPSGARDIKVNRVITD